MFNAMIEVLKANPRKIVFTEGHDARILEATARLKEGGFLTPILVGDVETVKANAAKGGFDIEGVEILEHNSLAWTPNLGTVKLPGTITTLGKNTFSRNILLGGFGRGDDKKVLTIEFNGTKAEWQDILRNSDNNWDGGLKAGSVVRCTDGYYELSGSWSLSWKEKSYAG